MLNWKSPEDDNDTGLQDIPGFPFDEYMENVGVYEEAEQWFTGAALEEQPESPGKNVDLYPLRINPNFTGVIKRAYVMFGEYEDGSPLVETKFIPGKKELRKSAREVENILRHVWWENQGNATLMEASIMSQIYGGVVFKIGWTPWDKTKKYPLSISHISPKYFVGTPRHGDNFSLADAWIVRKISVVSAREWGYSGGLEDTEMVWFCEHWNRTRYETFIDGKPALFIGEDGKRYPLIGPNPWGVVPIVYIPRIRTGSFYGQNSIDHLKGLIKEYNLRFADLGDAVSDESHRFFAMRNVSASPQVKKLAGREILDIGANTQIQGNEPDPDIFEVGKTNIVSPSMSALVDEILAQIRRDSFIPPVADGEDEGSQRSGLTLAMRFWPLTMNAKMERLFFSAGLDAIQKIILLILKEKTSEVTDEQRQMIMKQMWSPMLPRDREALITEWTSRAGTMLGSIETLLGFMGDIDDVEEEKERIFNEFKELAKIQADVAAESAKAVAEATAEANPAQPGAIKAEGKPSKKPVGKPAVEEEDDEEEKETKENV